MADFPKTRRAFADVGNVVMAGPSAAAVKTKEKVVAVYKCDHACGFTGTFADVSAHERACARRSGAAAPVTVVSAPTPGAVFAPVVGAPTPEKASRPPSVRPRPRRPAPATASAPAPSERRGGGLVVLALLAAASGLLARAPADVSPGARRAAPPTFYLDAAGLPPISTDADDPFGAALVEAGPRSWDGPSVLAAVGLRGAIAAFKASLRGCLRRLAGLGGLFRRPAWVL